MYVDCQNAEWWKLLLHMLVYFSWQVQVCHCYSPLKCKEKQNLCSRCWGHLALIGVILPKGRMTGSGGHWHRVSYTCSSMKFVHYMVRSKFPLYFIDDSCDISFDPANMNQYIVWANGRLGETVFYHFSRAGRELYGSSRGGSRISQRGALPIVIILTSSKATPIFHCRLSKRGALKSF